jgi:hypothetical protein
MLMFGLVQLRWRPVGETEEFVVYRANPSRFTPEVPGEFVVLAALPGSATSYDDLAIEDGATYFYAVASTQGGITSPLSNHQRITAKVPSEMKIAHEHVEVAAYYLAACSDDDQLHEMARLDLIFESSFPGRTYEYLKNKVHSLKHDVPEFKGVLHEPSAEAVAARASDLCLLFVARSELDYFVGERQLLLRKLQKMIALEFGRH